MNALKERQILIARGQIARPLSRYSAPFKKK
jgi:hypothetical protein